MCRPDSVAASRLVDLYTEIQREHARKKAENENNRDAGLDQEKAELDAAHIRLKATLQALRAARTAKEDLAEDSTDARAVANTQIATLQTQLEEDRMRMTVAKEILQTSREMFPVDTAYTDDQLWEMLRGLVHSQCVNATPQTELDRLRALHKGAKESWVNFLMRYEQMAPHLAPNYSGEHTRVLMEKLPDHIRRTVLSMDPGTSLSTLCAALKNVVYWETATTAHRKGLEPMDFGVREGAEEEEYWRSEYKPIVREGKILYENISGPKTLMIAWKALIRDRKEYRAESLRHLQKPEGGHMRRTRLLDDEEEADADALRTFVPPLEEGEPVDTIDLFTSGKMNETSEEQNKFATHVGLQEILKAEDMEEKDEVYARMTLVSSEDMKYGRKLKIVPEVMINKDGAEENSHVMTIVNNRWMRKKKLPCTFPFVLTGKGSQRQGTWIS